MAESNDFNAMSLQDYAKTEGAVGTARIQPCTSEDGKKFTALALLQPNKKTTNSSGQEVSSWLLLSWSKKWKPENMTLDYVKNHMDNMFVTVVPTTFGNTRATLFEGAETEDLW